MIGWQNLHWEGDKVYLARRKLAEIVQDQVYPSMWRVRKADGTLSGMLNRSRAKDAATGMAVVAENGRESAAQPVVVR